MIADEAFITESIMDPAAKIHRGFPLLMPSLQGQLSPLEVAGIIELIRSISRIGPQPAPPAAQPGKP